MTEAQRLKNMEVPAGKVDMVLDTDAFNEIDDQFAIAYTLRSSDKCHLREIYAAPFLNKKVVSAEEGMEASYAEIRKILDLAGCGEMKARTYRGSTRFMAREDEPVDSPAARALIALGVKPGYKVAVCHHQCGIRSLAGSYAKGKNYRCVVGRPIHSLRQQSGIQSAAGCGRCPGALRMRRATGDPSLRGGGTGLHRQRTGVGILAGR